MNKIINEILNLKKLKRDNYYFMRRRVNKGNGKKTLGWMLQSENNDMIYENKDFNVLYNQKLKLEVGINETSK